MTNDPPVITTETIPAPVKGEPYSFEIEAVDDSTPFEFITWDLDYAESFYSDSYFYMEGNVLKGGPFHDIRSDIHIVIIAWDHEGASSSRTYEININWINEPPILLKYPRFVSTGSKTLHLSVGTDEASDIQYHDPEYDSIDIRPSVNNPSHIYVDHYRSDILEITRRDGYYGKWNLSFLLEDDHDNDILFTIEVEFRRYDVFSEKDFHMVDLSDSEVHFDNSEMVFAIAAAGSDEPILFNMSGIMWSQNGTEILAYEPIFRMMFPAGHYNLSVTFGLREEPDSDSITLWKHIEVKRSGMKDVEEDGSDDSGSWISEACFLGGVLPLIILLPMILIYIIRGVLSLRSKGGDEE